MIARILATVHAAVAGVLAGQCERSIYGHPNPFVRAYHWARDEWAVEVE